MLSLITTYSSEVSVWLIQLIGSTLFVLILETKNSDNKYLFRANSEATLVYLNRINRYFL